MKKNRQKSYFDAFREYQDKMYLPGFYVGDKIPPYLKAKTRAGGYFMIGTGIVLLLAYATQLIHNFSLESIASIIPITFSILLLVVGLKFLKLHSRK